jgi:hypothetical protein
MFFGASGVCGDALFESNGTFVDLSETIPPRADHPTPRAADERVVCKRGAALETVSCAPRGE